MRTKRRITRAYCVELDESVTIASARRAYFSAPEPRQRFLFLCSSPECRELPVMPKITAVNYDVHKSESRRVNTPHFKDNGKYEHHADCEWVIGDDDDASPRPGESALEAKTRLARRQLKSMIDIFDPAPEPDTAMPRLGGQGVESPGEPGTRAASPGTAEGTRKNSKSKSKDLRRLVDAYTEAKETLDEDDFKNLKIEIKGSGVMTLRSYFLPTMYAKPNIAGRVYWGWCQLLPRRNESFVLRFSKGIEDKPTYLKVSAATMSAYKSKGYVNDLLSNAPSAKFLICYFLGTFEHDPGNDSYSAVVTDLSRLAIDLGPEK